MGAVCLLPLVGCSDDDTEGTGPEPTSDFQFETLELTQGSFKVKITPEDKNMTYFFGVLEKSDFSQFENLESLQAAKLLQKSEMRKDIVIELSYKGFG